MRKLRVGIWLQENYVPTTGGGFGYYTEMVEAISTYPFKETEIIFLTDTPGLLHHNFGEKQIESIKWRLARYSILYRILRFLSSKLHFGKRLRKYFKSKEDNEKKVLYDELYSLCDVIYYLVPGCKFPEFPYIYTLWDLGHLSSYAFPELVYNQNFESRKRHHDYLPHKALMVFCETHAGKQDAVKYLNLNPERIRVLPLFPSGVSDKNVDSIKPTRLNPNDKFIHYPAQFWAHKNHFGLLQAFKTVLEEINDLKLIFTGSDKGNLKYIEQTIKELSIESSVIYLGFVSNQELRWIYENSSGLVMPTLLGPSNIPPLEALSLGCPVAVSDLTGHRELLGESALYFNPLDFGEIANAIKQLIKNPPQIQTKLRSAKDNMPLLERFFAEIRTIRFMWGEK